MADPITKIIPETVDPEVVRENDKEALLTALLERKESVEGFIEIIEKMDERGLLDLVNGLLGQGEKVLAIAAKELNKPNVTDTLDHLMNLASMVGHLNTEKLKGLADQVNAGLDSAEEVVNSGARTSLFDLMKALKDPEINRSITALLGFLKGAGSKRE